MNIPECISFINRRTLCCGLLLTLLSYGYAQQRTGEEVSGKPMMLYFHFDRVLVDSSYMDNSRTFRHMDQLFTILSIMPHTIETDTLTFLQSGKTMYPQRNPVAASCRRRPLLALKTNLLFDAALMPNVEIEVPVGKRWSVNGEYAFPWWQFDRGKYCMQVLMGGLEGRYWRGSRKSREDREVLTGHFLGLYAGGGKYDLQWGEKGYQGEFFIAAGVSYGWATRIARHLHLEFNIGIGLLRTDYRHYHARDNYQTLLWQENGKYTWFGPTKAKISLVWLLNRRVKKGGSR